MKKSIRIMAGLLTFLAAAPSMAALNITLEVLPNPPEAPKGTSAKLVDADGSDFVFVGSKPNDGGKGKIPLAYHWNAQQGFSHLGLLNNRNVLVAMDISDDGKKVVGHNGGQSFFWTKQSSEKQNKMQEIPRLKSNYISTAISMSADGETVVGYAGWGDDMAAFRWQTGNGKLSEIGTGKDKLSWRSATFVSQDASVIVGSTGKDVYKWSEDAGFVALKDPQGCSFIAEDVSHDGTTIAGRCSVDMPVIWNESQGYVFLPMPDGAKSTMITAMSGDGKRFLGSTRFEGNDYETVKKPILWDNNTIYFLDNIIREQRGNRIMNRVWVSNISSDGNVIVGGYQDNNGRNYPIKLTLTD